jgi:hypothetical protein
VILGGDLNLTLNFRKIQGEATRRDPLGDYFSQLFENIQLVDLEPIKIVLTWRNVGRGREGISKRKDQFPMEEPLFSENIKIKS